VVTVASTWRFESVLDVGCGAGNLLNLFKHGDVKVAGADLSPKMIEKAKKRLGKTADLRVADSENLPWSAGTFDLVVSTDSLHHWPDPVKAFSEMRRVLKLEGRVIIGDVWVPSLLRQLGNLLVRFGKEGDVRVYSEGEVRRMLNEAGFFNVERAASSLSAILMHAKARK
jgi:ubiquinone/menaquinone biosynthesis C-methylase UbiE